MVTEKVKIDSQGMGVEKALSITEKAGTYGDLDKRETIRLRLLAEELIGLMRGIAGDIDADFWIEKEGNQYVLKLQSDVDLSKEMRQQFLDVSSSGTNSAVKGFMGKIRESIAVALLPTEDINVAMQGVTLGLMTMGCPEAYENNVNAYMWSLQRYKTALDGVEDAEKEEAWDELEKSVVASIADDVQVSVKGSSVEISIIKQF